MKRLAPTALAILALLLGGCAVDYTITLNADGSGVNHGRIQVQQGLADYVDAFAPEARGDKPFFDVATIKSEMEKNTGLKVVSLDTPNEFELDVEAEFKSIGEVFAKASERADVVSYQSEGKSRELALDITKENFAGLFGMMPEDLQIILEALGPQAGEQVTREEYLEFIPMLLGDEGVPMIEKSKISVLVIPPGRITDIEGGRREGRGVRFEFPLLDLLVLEHPLHFAVRYEVP